MVDVFGATKSCYSLQTRFGALAALHGFDCDTSFGQMVTTKTREEFQPEFLHSVSDESLRLSRDAFRATLETTPALLLPELPPEDHEGLGHEPDFIATLGGQRSELVRSLLPFIAMPGDEPSKFTWRLSATRERSSFRVRGGAPFRDAKAIGWLQRNSGRSGEGRVS